MEKYNLKSVGTISESCMLVVCFCKVLSTARLTVKTTRCRLSISNLSCVIEKIQPNGLDLLEKFLTLIPVQFRSEYPGKCFLLKIPKFT